MFTPRRVIGSRLKRNHIPRGPWACSCYGATVNGGLKGHSDIAADSDLDMNTDRVSPCRTKRLGGG